MATYRKKYLMRRVILILAFMTVQQSYSQHHSVLVSESPGVCEPSIKLDPSDPQIMVAGLILNKAVYSHDGGHSWTENEVTSPYGVWGDPVIEVDTAGNFYFLHLSNPPDGDWIDRIVCQRSEDGGQSWNEGSYAGLNGEKDQDKHWTVVDRASNILYVTWTEFDKYGSEDSTCYSRIRFSKSMDMGVSWSTPKTINTTSGNCLDDDETVEGAVPAVGPEGQLYVSWAGPNGVSFSSSYDQGSTWTQEISIDPMPGGWNYDIPGIYRANGLPVTKCDLSGGPHHGDIYVNWSDQRNGVENTDVWISQSSDEGKTWSEVKRVNQDESISHQFFTWMDIDQATGNIFVVYYDRRHAGADKLLTSIYMSMSVNGAESFVDFPLLSERDDGFIPDEKVFFGDYTNLTVHDGICRPIWTRMDEGNLSVWSTVVDTQKLAPGLFHIRPEFNLEQEGTVSLILSQNGKRKQLLTERQVAKGNSAFSYIWNAGKLLVGEYELQVIKGKEVLWTEQFVLDGESNR